MDWLNPVEWLAWLYGKVFKGHALGGGIAVVASFAIVGLVLWLRAVDKYNEEHDPRPTITGGDSAEVLAGLQVAAASTEQKHPVAPPSGEGAVGIGGSVTQSSTGNCSPNIIGGKTVINCGPITLKTLKPGNLPDPQAAGGIADTIKHFGITIPADAFKVYFGDCLGFTTKQDMVVLRVGDKDLLGIHRSPSGVTIDAKIFDSDGKIVVGVDHNVVRPNTNNVYYVESPDPSTIIVHDQHDEIVLQIKYLNPKSIKVNGVFRYGGSSPVVMDDTGIRWARGVVSGTIAGENGGAFLGLPAK